MIKKQRAVVNFETAEAVPQRKTVSLINNFVISTTQFINRFAFLCERKLSQISTDIDNLELTLCLLEAKLASIPGLEAVTASSAPPSAASSSSSSSSAAAPAAAAAPSPSSYAVPADEVQPMPLAAAPPPGLHTLLPLSHPSHPSQKSPRLSNNEIKRLTKGRETDFMMC